jgi:hypothetical protein
VLHITELFGHRAPVAAQLARTVGKCSGAYSGRFTFSPSVNRATCGAVRQRFSYKTTNVEPTHSTAQKDPKKS